ncbi:MAG: tRNA preQ1(34) S-adenosylmethionine ribosyltransferase-isomerase QueA [Candidatus Acidiferrales bacterium]|jgi:S-adenosylmethionine:tRNA ribosyltransferase-isomerase
MNLDELNFDLPPERIAQHPLATRDASRMLLLDKITGAWEDRQFREFPDLLRGDELIILNNARVLPARLFGRRVGIHAEPPGIRNPARHEHLQSAIEVLLVRQLSPDTWETLVRPGRKISVGEKIIFGEGRHDGEGELEAVAESRGEYGQRTMRFTSKSGFHEALSRLGHIPLPPYIKRADEPADRERYQTIYARQGSAVAAPTAGLHFTPEILKRIRARNIEIAEMTLDVGLGTFEPVRTERLEDHKIHVESYEIPEATAQAIAQAREEKRPILAVGTTVVRALEDVAEKSAQRNGSSVLTPGKSEAAIFLYPGKPLRLVNQLLTNFHLPQSSLLALVATLAGKENILRAYRHAVAAEYRFYSYGDCMLIR